MLNKLTIIMYHYVRPIKGSRFPYINGLELEGFKNQIEYIKKYYYVISMTDYILAEEAKEKLPENSMILSFDDGYKDHKDYVFPVLEKNKLKAIFFPVGKSSLEHKVLDVNKVHFILDANRNYQNLIHTIEQEIELDINNNLENIHYYRKKYYVKNRYDNKEVNYIKRLLQTALPYKFRSKITSKLFSKNVTKDEKDFSDSLYLNTSDLKLLKNYGMEIGSHGYDHFWLENINESEQISDIKKSLDFLNKINCIKDKLIFCYPYGSYSIVTKKILKNLNFNAALTTKVGIVESNNHDILELPRLDTNDLPNKKKSNISYWTKKITF